MVTTLRRNRHDLVLTDMRMSDTDGYGVLALLRNSNIGQSGTLPVLAVTARVDSDAARFREAGFAGCLHKPFSGDELMAATRGVERPDFTSVMEGEEHADELLDISSRTRRPDLPAYAMRSVRAIIKNSEISYTRPSPYGRRYG